MTEEILNAEIGTPETDEFFDDIPEAGTPETGAGSEAPAVETPVDPQVNALKAGILATGNFHLGNIYRKKVDESHAKTANIVLKIMAEMVEMGHATSFTHDEVIIIWDRIENDVK